MSIPLGLPVWRAFDSDGNPLAGGKLYSYEPGGAVTPKSTYTDSGGLTANANPVILDANGEAAVWLKGNYYLALDDASDVSQWTVDNYPSLDGTTQAEVTVTPTGGTAIATASGLVPQGARLQGVTVLVSTALGVTQSLVSFHVGYSFDGNLIVDAYGRDIALALNTTTTGADFTSSDMPIPTSGTGDIVLSAVGGLFDGTGAVKVRVYYTSYASPS